MKICFPVAENKGLESVPYNHFGSAPLFLIYDTEAEKLKTIENKDLHHAHGMCQPLKALDGEKVDAILVGGIGAGALMKLKNEGVRVYKVASGTILDNMELIKTGKMLEFTLNNSCNNHNCGH